MEPETNVLAMLSLPPKACMGGRPSLDSNANHHQGPWPNAPGFGGGLVIVEPWRNSSYVQEKHVGRNEIGL